MHEPKYREAHDMTCNGRRRQAIFLMAVVSIAISWCASAEGEVIDLRFEQSLVSDSDTSRTMESLIRVQGTGQFVQDGLYLMTHYGDREEIFRQENQNAIDNPLIDQTWRHCSIFSWASENSVLMGRNWDNQNVGSIIINLYNPPEGYSSISFCRSIDMGFGHKDLEQHKSSVLGHKLLSAPFHATDGINEHGLAVSVAGVQQTTHNPEPGRELIFITFLVRKILDQARTIEEAADLVEGYIPFDLDKNTLCTHFFVVDSSGRSVVLEYVEDQWRRIYGNASWQVLTNKPVYDVPDAVLRERCWRYQSISESIEDATGNMDWQAAMKILKDVTQKGTTWAVVYSPTSRDLYFSVYQDWDTIYHLTEF
jgi:hypothetical protein